MDDRSFWIVVAILAGSFLCVVVDAALVRFDVPAGYWTVMAAALGFLGARGIFKGCNGKDGES